MHFLDFLCSSAYYPGANVLNSIATIHIQANLLSGFFFLFLFYFFLKQLSQHKLWRAHLWSGDKSAWLAINGMRASHPKQHCVSVIYSQRRSRQDTTNSSTFIKHRGKWPQKRNAHPGAHTFINRLWHACSHMTCAALSGWRQTSAATINVLQHICVPLPVFLLPEGGCGRDFGKDAVSPSLMPPRFTARQTQSHMHGAFMN